MLYHRIMKILMWLMLWPFVAGYFIFELLRPQQQLQSSPLKLKSAAAKITAAANLKGAKQTDEMMSIIANKDLIDALDCEIEMLEQHRRLIEKKLHYECNEEQVIKLSLKSTRLQTRIAMLSKKVLRLREDVQM